MTNTTKANGLDDMRDGATFAVPVPVGRIRIKAGKSTEGDEGRHYYLEEFDPNPWPGHPDGQWKHVTTYHVVAGSGRPRVVRRPVLLGYTESTVNGTRAFLTRQAEKLWADMCMWRARSAARKAARTAQGT